MEDQVKGIITAGYAAGKTEDDMKMEMFSAGVKFSQLQSMFKTTAIALGLMVDPKVVTAGIKAQVEESDWTACETAAHVDAFIDQITGEVKGATKMRVCQVAKGYCKEKGIVLPEPVKVATGTRSRVGTVSKVAVDYFNATQEPTKEGMFNAILPHVKAGKNARENTNLYFNVMFAIRNSVELMDAVKTNASMEYPEVEEVAPVVEEAPAMM